MNALTVFICGAALIIILCVMFHWAMREQDKDNNDALALLKKHHERTMQTLNMNLDGVLKANKEWSIHLGRSIDEQQRAYTETQNDLKEATDFIRGSGMWAEYSNLREVKRRITKEYEQHKVSFTSEPPVDAGHELPSDNFDSVASVGPSEETKTALNRLYGRASTGTIDTQKQANEYKHYIDNGLNGESEF